MNKTLGKNLRNLFLTFCGATAIGFYSCNTLDKEIKPNLMPNYSLELGVSQRQIEINEINKLKGDMSFMYSRIRLLDETEQDIPREDLELAEKIIKEFRKTDKYKTVIDGLSSTIKYNRESMQETDKEFNSLVCNFIIPKIYLARDGLQRDRLEYELNSLEDKLSKIILNDSEKELVEQILYGGIKKEFTGDLKEVPGFFDYLDRFRRQQCENGVFERQYNFKELDAFTLSNFLMNNHLPTNFKKFYDFFIADEQHRLCNTLDSVWLNIGKKQKRILRDEIPIERDTATELFYKDMKKEILNGEGYPNEYLLRGKVDVYILKNADIFGYITKKITKDVYMSKIKKEIK